MWRVTLVALGYGFWTWAVPLIYTYLYEVFRAAASTVTLHRGVKTMLSESDLGFHSFHSTFLLNTGTQGVESSCPHLGTKPWGSSTPAVAVKLSVISPWVLEFWQVDQGHILTLVWLRAPSKLIWLLLHLERQHSDEINAFPYVKEMRAAPGGRIW